MFEAFQVEHVPNWAGADERSDHAQKAQHFAAVHIAELRRLLRTSTIIAARNLQDVGQRPMWHRLITISLGKELHPYEENEFKPVLGVPNDVTICALVRRRPVSRMRRSESHSL